MKNTQGKNDSSEANQPPQTRRAAVAQLCATSDKLRNLLDVAKCAGWAKSANASMLFLPECFGFIGSSSAQTIREAECFQDDQEEQELRQQRLTILQEALKRTVDHHALTTGESYTTETSDDEYSVEKVSQHVRESFSQLSSGLESENDESELGWPILFQGLRTIARRSQLWISAGGMHELPPSCDNNNHHNQDQAPTRKKVYNTHLILDEHGDIVAKYRKIHLFDVDVPSANIRLRESDTTLPGTELCVTSTENPLGCAIGLATCYDLRFPELFEALTRDETQGEKDGNEQDSWKGGAKVVLVPSAFTVPTGHAHWHTLLKARAIDNQCYIIASAQYGKHNEKRSSYGHSLVIDPWGTVVVDAGGVDGPPCSNQDAKKNEIMQNAPPFFISDDGAFFATNREKGADSSTLGVAASNENLKAKIPSIVLCDLDLGFLTSIRQRMPIRMHRQSRQIEKGPSLC